MAGNRKPLNAKTLERRIFLVSSLVIFLLYVVGFLSVIFLDTSWWSQVMVLVACGVYGALFILVQRKVLPVEKATLPFFISLLVFLSIHWFTFNGIRGNLPLAYLMVWVLMMVIFPAKRHLVVSLVIVANIGFFLLMEKAVPDSVTIIPESGIKEVNRWVFFIVFAFAAALMVSTLKRTFQGERNRAIQRQKEVENFSYIASHDLRGPLRGISSLAEWIKEDLQENIEGETSEHFELLGSRIRRMENLLNGILAYNKAGLGKGVNEQINTHELLDRLIQKAFQDQALHIHVQENLPGLKADPELLAEVFYHLIDNAIQFNDKDIPVVSVSHKEMNGEAWYFVSDNGPGIPVEFHVKIFEMFKTLQPRDDKETNGIGLAIVKKIIDEIGGKINVESVSGKGATFSFYWPQ